METDTIQIPIALIKIVSWVAIAGIGSMTVVFVSLLLSLRDSAQQKHMEHESHKRNSRADTVIVFNTILELLKRYRNEMFANCDCDNVADSDD